MIFDSFIWTGTRGIRHSEVLSVDLWKTDQQAEILLIEGARLLLDEDESRMVREWAQMATQAAIASSQADLVETRCDLQEQLARARRLNRAHRRRRARRPAANVVKINARKSGPRPAA
jgi:pantothenate kinase